MLTIIILPFLVLGIANWIYKTRPDIVNNARGRATVASRLEEFGPAARERWKPRFEKAEVSYPPTKVLLVALKQEKLVEVWAAGDGQSLKPIAKFPVKGASGGLGPKLEQGDFQVPEGFYKIESINPNSSYHLGFVNK